MSLARLLTRAEAPKPVASKVLATAGNATRALEALHRDPYDAIRQAGGTLDVADRLAALLKLSLDRRALGHAEWTLSSRATLGLAMLTAKLRCSLELPDVATKRIVKKMIDAGSLVAVDGQVTSKSHYDKNVSIARDITQRAMRTPNDALCAAFERIDNVTPAQKLALTAAAHHKFSVITGGPGTGKSHLVRKMVDAFPHTKVTAPTGRAARNACGKTVHYFRTIQESGTNDFAGARLIIVDEASMLSTELMWTVLTLAPAAAHIVLVGDVDQLPPIDAGDVLRDVISCGKVPVTVLDHNHRSSTAIQSFAAGILEGAVRVPDSGVVLLPCETLEDVINTVPGINDPTRDIILTPHNVTRIALNRAMQLYRWSCLDELEIVLRKEFPDAPRGAGGIATIASPRATPPSVTVYADHGTEFHATLSAACDLVEVDTRVCGIRAEAGTVLLPGDMVIITKNTPDVCNGDIGIFLTQDRVSFLGQSVTVPTLGETDPGMTLAYAVTVHKAQGSEFQRVFLPVTNVSAWDRALLYTAVTRAKGTVYILGSLDDLRTIVTTVRPARPSLLRALF